MSITFPKEALKRYDLEVKIQNFTERVKEIVRTIPKGTVKTYKEVASLAGNQRAARAVGNIMRANFDTSIPCHRVIRSNGSIGAYNRGGEKQKRELLTSEGYTINIRHKA